MQEFQTNFRQVLGSLPPSVKYLPIVFPKSTSKYENLWLCLRLHLHNFYGLILFPELPRCVQITECLAMSFIIISNLQTVLARANIFAKLTQTCVKISIHQILLSCHTAKIHTTHTHILSDILNGYCIVPSTIFSCSEWCSILPCTCCLSLFRILFIPIPQHNAQCFLFPWGGSSHGRKQAWSRFKSEQVALFLYLQAFV